MEGAWNPPSTSVGAILVVFFICIMCRWWVSLVFRTRREALASFLPKLDVIVEAGFCLVFHVVL